MQVTTAESEGPEFVRQVRVKMDMDFIQHRAHVERMKAQRHLYQELGDWCEELGWPTVRWVTLKFQDQVRDFKRRFRQVGKALAGNNLALTQFNEALRRAYGHD